MTRFRALLLGLVGMVLTVLPATAQVRFSSESFHEIDALQIRADLTGGLAGDARVARILEDAIAAELRRAEIRLPSPEGRREFCCFLRLDVRIVATPSRFRGATGYSLRLELARPESSQGYPAWVVLWASRELTGFFEGTDLVEALRHAARDVADEFVDRFRERFPL